MRSLKEDEKKLLLLIILIALIAFTFVFWDLLQTLQAMAQYKFNDKPLSALEQAVKDITLSPKNENSAFIRDTLAVIFDEMNAMDYESLYERLSEDFREDIFDSSLESFSTYMLQYAPEKYIPKCTEYQKYGDTYVLNVSFLQYSDNITESNSVVLKQDYFCIRRGNDGEFTFSFAGFIGNKKSEFKTGNDLLTISLNESKLTRSASSFIIDFENHSDYSIVIPAKRIYVVTGIKPKYYTGSVLIPAQSTAKIQFTVYTGQSLSSALPDDIIFPNIKIGEEKYTFSLPIEYAIELN